MAKLKGSKPNSKSKSKASAQPKPQPQPQAKGTKKRARDAEQLQEQQRRHEEEDVVGAAEDDGYAGSGSGSDSEADGAAAGGLAALVSKKKARREKEKSGGASQDDEPESGDEQNGGGEGPTGGFADVMQKLLTRRVPTENPLLAKRHTARMKAAELEKKKRAELKADEAKKHSSRQKHMVVPVLETDAVSERDLKRIATRGVVALFNAIRQQQEKEAEDKADQTPGKGDKGSAGDGGAEVKDLTRESFLSLLKKSAGGSKTEAAKDSKEGQVVRASTASKVASAAGETGAPGKRRWAALDDGYMIGARARDWDAGAGDGAGSSAEEDGFELEREGELEDEGEF